MLWTDLAVNAIKVMRRNTTKTAHKLTENNYFTISNNIKGIVHLIMKTVIPHLYDIVVQNMQLFSIIKLVHYSLSLFI